MRIVTVICALFALSVGAAHAGEDPLAGGTTYAAKDHPKAVGHDISLRYPAGWTTSDSSGAHIIQMFNPQGSHAAGCLVSLMATTPDKDAELDRLIADRTLMGVLLPRNNTLVSADAATLDGRPAARLAATSVNPRQTATVYTHVLQYYANFDHALVLLGCFTAGTDKAQVDADFTRYQPLFEAISASVRMKSPGSAQ